MMAVVAMSRTFDMKQLGADAKGIKSCTELINRTIEKAASEGGGTIYFPAGTYLTATIHMKSNITLYLESGAVLRFSDKFEDYLPFVTLRWEGTVMKSLSPLIYAHSADNVTISGRGTLDGNGLKWWLWEFDTRKVIKENGGKLPPWINCSRCGWTLIKIWKYLTITKPSLERRMFRPPFYPVLRMYQQPYRECKDSKLSFLIRHFVITLQYTGLLSIIRQAIPKVPIRMASIQVPAGMYASPIALSASGDDCITIKSGRDADGRKYGKACENITITNCIMLSGHGGVVIGSEMSGGVKKSGNIQLCIRRD